VSSDEGAGRPLRSSREQQDFQAGNAALLKWARRSLRRISLDSDDLSDLKPLRAAIGQACVVSLGEGLHGSAEPLAFRNRLFRFLVEKMGFTAIAIESGLTASYAAAEFVAGGRGDAQSIAKAAITSGLGGFPQQAELLDWMRDYNAAGGRGRKIGFFGIDLESNLSDPGSPLDISLGFLDEVDGAFAADLRRRLTSRRNFLKIDRMIDRPDHYAHLPQADRDAVTAAISDMVNHFQVNEGGFAAATNEARYAAACRAAVGAWQGDQYLRQFPFGWTPNDPPVLGAVAVADRAKADNLAWVLSRQGDAGRILLFAHLGHVSRSPVSIRLGPSGDIPLPSMMGEYLQRSYGPRLVTIGHFLATDLTEFFPSRPQAADDSLEGVLARAADGAYLLDIRRAPPAVRRRLEAVHGLFGQLPVHSLRPYHSVDMILFTPKITSAL